jgi:hypothetical protein
MNLTQAIQILKLHNEWRRGAEIDMLSPKMIGEAIDKVIELDKSKFCPFCGYKKQHVVTTDINSPLTCSATWCPGHEF